MTLESALDQFTGTEQYHYNPMYRWLKYTDGVQYFATNAGGGAFWFLDIVGTEFRNLANINPFIAIDMTVADGKAVIDVTDGDGGKITKKKINFTDCPTGVYKFFLISGVLLLTSEY
jgi:hypothetical protein